MNCSYLGNFAKAISYLIHDPYNGYSKIIEQISNILLHPNFELIQAAKYSPISAFRRRSFRVARSVKLGS